MNNTYNNRIILYKNAIIFIQWQKALKGDVLEYTCTDSPLVLCR